MYFLSYIILQILLVGTISPFFKVNAETESQGEESESPSGVNKTAVYEIVEEYLLGKLITPNDTLFEKQTKQLFARFLIELAVDKQDSQNVSSDQKPHRLVRQETQNYYNQQQQQYQPTEDKTVQGSQSGTQMSQALINQYLPQNQNQESQYLQNQQQNQGQSFPQQQSEQYAPDQTQQQQASPASQEGQYNQQQFQQPASPVSQEGQYNQQQQGQYLPQEQSGSQQSQYLPQQQQGQLAPQQQHVPQQGQYAPPQQQLPQQGQYVPQQQQQGQYPPVPQQGVPATGGQLPTAPASPYPYPGAEGVPYPYPTRAPETFTEVDKLLQQIFRLNVTGILDQSLYLVGSSPVRNLGSGVLKLVFCDPISRLLGRCKGNDTIGRKLNLKV